MKTLVDVKNLVKQHGDTRVIDQVSFRVQQGEAFGILAPSGAGKSSLMKMLCGISPISSGDLFVVGLNAKKNFREIRSKIGIVLQEDLLDGDFSVFDNLVLHASYFLMDKTLALSRVEEIIHMTGLEKYQDEFPFQLNKEQRRQVSIAKGLVNHPEVLFLDEPSAGQDTDFKLWLWRLLTNLNKDGLPIVLSTSCSREAEVLCNSVALMDQGKFLAIDEPQQLIKNYTGSGVVELESNLHDIEYYFTKLMEKGFRSQKFEGLIRIYLNEKQTSKDLLSHISSQKMIIRSSHLSDVFTCLTGHRFHQESPL